MNFEMETRPGHAYFLVELVAIINDTFYVECLKKKKKAKVNTKVETQSS